MVSEDMEIHSHNTFISGTVDILESAPQKLTFMLLGHQTVKLGYINPSSDQWLRKFLEMIFSHKIRF